MLGAACTPWLMMRTGMFLERAIISGSTAEKPMSRLFETIAAVTSAPPCMTCGLIVSFCCLK